MITFHALVSYFWIEVSKKYTAKEGCSFVTESHSKQIIYSLADCCALYQQLRILLNIMYNSNSFLSLLQVDVFARPATRGRFATGRVPRDPTELAANRYAFNEPYVEPSCVGPIGVWSKAKKPQWRSKQNQYVDHILWDKSNENGFFIHLWGCYWFSTVSTQFAFRKTLA